MDKHELPEQEPNLTPEEGRVDFSDLGPLFSADHPQEEGSRAVDFSDLGPLFDGSQEETPSLTDAPAEESYTPRFAKEQEEDVLPEDAPPLEDTPGDSYDPLFAEEQEEVAPSDADESLSSEEAPEESYSPLFAAEQEEGAYQETEEKPSLEETSDEPYNPLFAAQQEEGTDQDTEEEPSLEETSEEPYPPLFDTRQEEDAQEAAEDFSAQEATEEPYSPPLQEDQDMPSLEEPAYQDPITSQEDQTAENSSFSPVLPGQAAWLLKKLNDLPRDSDQTDWEAPVISPEPQDALHFQEVEEETLLEEEPLSQEEPISEEEPISPEDAPVEAPEEEDAPQTESAEESEDSQVPEEIESAQEEPSEEPTAESAGEESAEEAEPLKKRTHKGNRPMRKGRPKRKKGEGFFGIPNLLVTVVWIAITVLIGITLGRMIWVCAADVLAFGREDQPVTITIYEADTIDDITRKLHEGHLIRYPGLFKFYASLAVDDGEIQPGIWDLNTRYDYHALVSMMSPSSSRDVVEVMIPEGYSCRQIFALLEENKICTATDLASYAASGELNDYWFLEGVSRGESNCLEGFLFPDTYQFYKNDSPKNVLQKMLSNFETKFDEEMQGQINTLNDHLADLMRKGGHGEDYIASHRFTVRDVINVASLIEKETSSAEEGYTIASVIYNRLFNWGDNVPYLNIDATIIYALGGKTKLTQEDLKVNSPYNTYTNTGLTPGPIANPGLASIRAALAPAESDYYYYVLDPEQGSHRFSTTYDEHKANIASIGG